MFNQTFRREVMHPLRKMPTFTLFHRHRASDKVISSLFTSCPTTSRSRDKAFTLPKSLLMLSSSKNNFNNLANRSNACVARSLCHGCATCLKTQWEYSTLNSDRQIIIPNITFKTIIRSEISNVGGMAGVLWRKDRRPTAPRYTRHLSLARKFNWRIKHFDYRAIVNTIEQCRK